MSLIVKIARVTKKNRGRLNKRVIIISLDGGTGYSPSPQWRRGGRGTWGKVLAALGHLGHALEIEK